MMMFNDSKKDSLLLKKSVLLIIAIFVFLVIGILSGCSSSSTDSSEESVDEKVTITFSFWGDPKQVEDTERILKKFEEKYPDINVDTWHAPWDNYFEKIQTRWAANESPDVMFLTDIPNYASKGVLKPLDDEIEEDGFELDNYNEAMLNAFTYDDELYGLPRDNDTKVFFYNKELFDEENIPYPEKDWTWDDFNELAQKLTKKQNGKTTQYGVAFEPDWWRLWVWGNGGKLFNDPINPSKTEMTQPEGVETIEFLSNLMREGYAPSYENQSDSSKISQLFMNNQVAIAFGNHALIPQMEDTDNLDWDIVGMPRVEGKEPVNSGGGAGYVISDDTEEFDASFKLWKFLLGEEGQTEFLKAGNMVPASKEAQESDEFLKDKDYDAEVFVEETSHAYPEAPVFPEWTEASQKFNSAFESVWIGETDADETLEEVEVEVNDLLD